MVMKGKRILYSPVESDPPLNLTGSPLAHATPIHVSRKSQVFFEYSSWQTYKPISKQSNQTS